MGGPFFLVFRSFPVILISSHHIAADGRTAFSCQTSKVRAHALYYAALTEVQQEEGSVKQSREYLRRVKEEFPGTHDCAVDTLLDEEGKI